MAGSSRTRRRGRIASGSRFAVSPRARCGGAAGLITIDGGDVRVAFYPLEKQAEVQARRIAATDAANRRWHGKLRGDAGADVTGEDATLDATPNASRIAAAPDSLPTPDAIISSAGIQTATVPPIPETFMCPSLS